MQGRDYIFSPFLIFTKHGNGNISKMTDKYTASNLFLNKG